MITKEEFPTFCLERFDAWFNHFKHQQYPECDEISDSHVQLCNKILTEKTWDSEEENNISYITGVLFAGLKEFVQLAQLTKDRKWHLDQPRTENVWNLLWNCDERFGFCDTYFKHEDFTWILRILKELKKDFILHFGPGLYSSPEILFKNETCSICQKDTRACLHISGKLYNGIMCYSMPQEVQLRSVSIVKIPRDPRCRIWAWNFNDDNTYSTPIYIFFTIDDWLTNDVHSSNMKKLNIS